MDRCNTVVEEKTHLEHLLVWKDVGQVPAHARAACVDRLPAPKSSTAMFAQHSMRELVECPSRFWVACLGGGGDIWEQPHYYYCKQAGCLNKAGTHLTTGRRGGHSTTMGTHRLPAAPAQPEGQIQCLNGSYSASCDGQECDRDTQRYSSTAHGQSHLSWRNLLRP